MDLITPLWRNHRLPLAATHEHKRLGKHAVQQALGLNAALVGLVQPLPLVEVLPRAGDRAISGPVAVRDDQEGVVMKRMGNDVFVQVIPQVAVEPGPDIFVNRLQLDEDQRQPVDKTHKVGAAVVIGRPESGQFQLAHSEKTVGAGAGRCSFPRA